jgi:preprotein translocase subunit SecF
MRFVKPNTNIDFIGKRNFAYIISLALIVISLSYLTVQGGPKAGMDFSGGTLIQIKFSGPVDAQTIRSALGDDMGNASVQNFGKAEDNEYLIRTNEPDTELNEHTQQLTEALTIATGKEMKIRRVKMVGPQVGEELREKASFALFYALLFITIYISGRFESKWFSSGIMVVALIFCVYVLSAFDMSIPILIVAAMIVAIALFWLLNLKYSMGAIVALLHDILITVGIFSVLGKEFSLPIVAALLTIVGYSLNDTIIVYDRIRENLKVQRGSLFHEVINKSINNTLSRTILTSGTTLIVLLALFIFGGDIIHDFALTMIIGVLVGTYSSIYVASPILLAWEKKQKK